MKKTFLSAIKLPASRRGALTGLSPRRNASIPKLQLLSALFLSLFFAGPCLAATYNFTWTPPADMAVASIRLYASQTSGGHQFGTGQLLEIPSTAKTVQFTPPPTLGDTLYWVITSVDSNGLESGPSNEVVSSLGNLVPAASEAGGGGGGGGGCFLHLLSR